MSYFNQVMAQLVAYRRELTLFWAISLLNAFDACFSTWMVYQFGLGSEVNPLMRQLMTLGLGSFFVVKLVLVTCLAAWLGWRQELMAGKGLKVLACCYGLVVLVEIGLLLGFLS